MSDTWRPFTLRRTIGGDVTRAVDGWQGALRFGPKDYPFDIVVGTTLTGIPIGYDSTLVTVSVPTSVPWQEAVLVRGGFGYPTTPLDGEAVWYYEGHDVASTEQFNQQVMDTPVTGGRWYYYTLFLCISDLPPPVPCEWNVGAHITVLVPKNYQHATRLFEMIPPFYQRADDQQAADGRHGPLRKFAAVIGYDCDYDRTLLDGVLDVYHADFSPLMFIQQVGANLGLPVEEALGGARYRSIIGRLWDLEAARGTGLGLQEFIYAASNYNCVVVQGYNSLLGPDDSEFVTGIGHWLKYDNPHMTDMANAVDSTHPPAGSYTNLVLRKYAAPDLTPVRGRGILEVIETPTAVLKDFAIVGGLSTDGEPDDWLHYGVAANKDAVWELQFYCCHKAGAPNATAVVGAFVSFDLQGNYIGTTKVLTEPPIVTDAVAWTRYSVQYKVPNRCYMFPAIWWQAATPLTARYLCGIQMAAIDAQGGAAIVAQPDIFLTLGATGKTLASQKAHLGPPQ